MGLCTNGVFSTDTHLTPPTTAWAWTAAAHAFHQSKGTSIATSARAITSTDNCLGVDGGEQTAIQPNKNIAPTAGNESVTAQKDAVNQAVGAFAQVLAGGKSQDDAAKAAVETSHSPTKIRSAPACHHLDQQKTITHSFRINIRNILNMTFKTISH
jgi:hypothetical protein